LKETPKTKFNDNVIQKPDVKRFTSDGVTFIDNSYQQIDTVLYCTGYRYTFPFLSVDCGLSVNDNCVEPLYKHVININMPTLAIIGLPNFVCPNQMFDFQVQFFLTLLVGKREYPSRREMLEDYEKDKHQQLIDRKMPRSKLHFFGVEYHDKYYNAMAEIAGIEPVKPVIAKMFAKGLCNTLFDCGGFRSDVFKVHDDENFTFIKGE
jgi:dimethylaniline monooxygenase (N-oxide forming)